MTAEPAARSVPALSRERQLAMYRRALGTLPGGTDSNFRAWGEDTVYLDRGKGGVLHSPSAYFSKHPAIQLTDDEAYQRVEEFIRGERKRHETASAVSGTSTATSSSTSAWATGP